MGHIETDRRVRLRRQTRSACLSPGLEYDADDDVTVHSRAWTE